jgi:hypothetical protein
MKMYLWYIFFHVYYSSEEPDMVNFKVRLPYWPLHEENIKFHGISKYDRKVSK